MGKVLVKATKKIITLTLALILLFNSGAELYGYALEISEEISAEIRETLQEVLAEQEGKKSYQKCLLGEEESCKKYLEKIKKEFIQAAKESGNKSPIEEKLSYKNYYTQNKAAIAKEYNRAIEEIEKEEREAIFFSNLTWKEINKIKYLSGKNKKEAEKWKQAQEDKIKDNYKDYEVSYEKWRKETEEKIEEAGKKYLKEEARKIIKAYNASNNKDSKEDARELLVVLINSEETPGEIVVQREESAKILREALLNNPCAYNKGSQTISKGGAEKYIGYDKAGVYPSLTREDWQIIAAGYKDEKACQNAFISLDGLSKLQGTKENQTSVVKFMEANRTGLAAGDSLLEGSAVLLKWKAYTTLRNYMKQNFALEKNNENKGVGGFGGISEAVAYNGNYLGEVSVWTQRADGSNAWEELADLLAEEGSAQSQEILKSAVSSCKVVKEIIGQDKLECQTIMPFLYGALISAPKVMDKAEPYQEAIPLEKEYMDKNGRLLVIDEEGIKRRNALIKKEFNEKIREYGSSVSRGLAGFLYHIKFNDMPVDAKMALDNRLAKVYSNIKGYSKGSKRYKSLQAGRAAVAIFKYVGIAADIWCFVGLAGLGVKVAGGTGALIKAKNLMKGVNALSVGQRANILRQIAFIQEGAKIRRFGRNFTAGIVNSANIGRRINASAYLAEKNGMNPINYMLHNIAYQRGKNIVLKKNILRVEGLESGEFYKSSHYIAGLHKDIFRINRDIRRAGKIGISELGEGGTVLSYIDKAKLGIFKNYTEDYLKGQEIVKGSEGGKIRQGLMKGETSLLPREYLYSGKYKKILPFVQDLGYTKKFKLGENMYKWLRREGLYVYNTQTGQIFNDFSFHLEGYLNKEGILGGLTKKVRPGKALERHFYSAKNPQGSVINNPQGSANLAVLNKGLEKGKLTLSLNFTRGIKGIVQEYSSKVPAFSLLAPTLLSSNLSSQFGATKYLSTKAPSSQKTYKPGETLDLFEAEYNKAPLIIFQGGGVVPFAPSHIARDNLFSYDLSKTKDYRDFIAREIRNLSETLKEYTIYIEIHGDKEGVLSIDDKNTTSLNTILDIIEENKGESTVNVISGSCHSGSALDPSLQREGINVLLVSGVNDVCSVYDANFIRINDLRSSYVEAIKNRHYGAYLFYEGKIFNTLIDTKASLPKENPVREELDLWRKIYFSKNSMGANVYNLLSKFSNYESPQYSFMDFLKFPQPPRVFNLKENLDFFNTYIQHDKKRWKYITNIYNDKWDLVDTKEIFFSEPKEETYSLLVKAVQKELKKAFPEWSYTPVPEVKFPGAPVMQTPEDSFLLSGDKKTSFLPGSNSSPAENVPSFSLLVPTLISSNLRTWLSATKYLSEKQKKVLPPVFDRALSQAAQAYVERQKAFKSASKEDFIDFASPYLTLHLNAAGLSPLQTNSILTDFKAKEDLLEFSLQSYEENFKLAKNLEEIVAPLIDQDLLNAVPEAKIAFSKALLQTEEYIGELTQEKLKGVKDIFASSFLTKLTQEGVSLEDKRKLLANFDIVLEEDSALGQIQQDFDKALQSAMEHADKIGSSAEKIKNYFTNHEKSLKNVIEIIGLKGLTHSYQGKIEELNNLCNYADLIKNNFSEQAYELLLQKINPKQSKKYQELTREMNILRQKAASDPAFRKQRNEITSLQRKTGEGAGLLVQDVLDKFKIIASIAEYNLPFAEDLVAFILPKMPENELLWKRKYQTEIFKKMGIEFSPELLERVKITENSNIAPLLKARVDTKENIKEIFDLIDKNPGKSIAEIMEALPWNRRTKNIFKKLGVKWEAWARPSADNVVKTQIRIDALQEKEKFIEEVNIYTSSILKNYPNLQSQALQKGIALKEETLYLDEEPVKTFTQATRVVSTIKKLIVSSEQQEVSKIISSEFTKQLPHKAEVLSSLANGTQNITVRLADTNDISAILSLGEKSACCRALGRLHEEAVSSLITNKMATAFEILAEDKVIGSIMVYLASVNGDLALVLGSLHTQALYSKNKAISKAVVNFARKFAAKIGKQHIPIYMAAPGQDKEIISFANQDDLPPGMARFISKPFDDYNTYKIKALGKIGKHPLYLSYNISKTKETNFEAIDYLYHLEYPFEEREKIAYTTKLIPFINYIDYLNPSHIFSDFKKRSTRKTINFTEESARQYLMELDIEHVEDIETIIEYCYENGKFSSEYFSLFVKGFEIKPDIYFSLIAFNTVLKGDIFDYARYSKIYYLAKKLPSMSYDKIVKYSRASKAELNALFYIAENRPDLDPFKVIKLADYRGEFNPTLYNKLVLLLDKGISDKAISELFSICIDNVNTGKIFNEEIFKQIDKVAQKAIEKKDKFLSAANKKFTNADIKSFIYLLAPKIKETLDLCNETTLFAAMDYKMDKFEEFVKMSSVLKSRLNYYDIYEMFLENFYPSKSRKAEILQNEIKELKSKFASTGKENLEDLKNDINTKTRKLRSLLAQESKLSPQDKIEIIEILSSFDDQKELEELINSAAKGDLNSFNKKIYSSIKKT